jgi:hypothetical protein
MALQGLRRGLDQAQLGYESSSGYKSPISTPLFSPLLCHFCLYGQVGYRLKVRTCVSNSNTGHKLGSFTTQCDLALIQSGEQELRSSQTSAPPMR